MDYLVVFLVLVVFLQTRITVTLLRRVGVNKERLTGSTAVGNKSASRNELGNPNDTA